MDGLLDDNFLVNIPLEIDLEKSQATGEPTEMRIRGYASTPSRDRQSDSVVQKGLDISDFLDFGFLNYDHDNTKIVGYPDSAKTRIDNTGFYVEGVLLPNVPLAKSIWDTAVALQKSNAPRRLGFSIEGKTLKKSSSGQILQAKVYNVAVTPNPVNTDATWEALVKSLEAGYGEANGNAIKVESLESAFHTLAKALGGNEDASKALNFLKEKMGLQKSVDTDELTLYFQLYKGLSRQDAEALVLKLEKQGGTTNE